VGMNALATLAGGGVFVQSVCVCVCLMFFFSLSLLCVCGVDLGLHGLCVGFMSKEKRACVFAWGCNHNICVWMFVVGVGCWVCACACVCVCGRLFRQPEHGQEAVRGLGLAPACTH